RGDGKTVAYLLERDFGFGLHLLCYELGLSKDQRQRHRKTGGVGRAYQLFRVRARLALEAAGEAVRVILQRAALGRNGALAVLDAALPFGRSECRWHVLLHLGE